MLSELLKTRKAITVLQIQLNSLKVSLLVNSSQPMGSIIIDMDKAASFSIGKHADLHCAASSFIDLFVPPESVGEGVGL